MINLTICFIGSGMVKVARFQLNLFFFEHSEKAAVRKYKPIGTKGEFFQLLFFLQDML